LSEPLAKALPRWDKTAYLSPVFGKMSDTTSSACSRIVSIWSNSRLAAYLRKSAAQVWYTLTL
jgi:hypothetical protein